MCTATTMAHWKRTWWNNKIKQTYEITDGDIGEKINFNPQTFREKLQKHWKLNTQTFKNTFLLSCTDMSCVSQHTLVSRGEGGSSWVGPSLKDIFFLVLFLRHSFIYGIIYLFVYDRTWHTSQNKSLNLFSIHSFICICRQICHGTSICLYYLR